MAADESGQTYIDRTQCVRDRPMEVLCLGPGRTGTDSMRVALKTLGFDDCYHGYSCVHEIAVYEWINFYDAHGQSLGPAVRNDTCRCTGLVFLWLLILVLMLHFPDIAIIAALTLAPWEWRWRRTPYDLETPPKSRYLGTLKSPQHESDPEDVCSRCREEFDLPLELSRGHVFCKKCIKGVMKHNQTRCPLCNRPQFTPIEPWAVLLQIIAMAVGFFSPNDIKANPRPTLNLINIIEMSNVGILAAAIDHDLGDDWIAQFLFFPVAPTFLWLIYTGFFAGYVAILLQQRLWGWPLLNLLGVWNC